MLSSLSLSTLRTELAEDNEDSELRRCCRSSSASLITSPLPNSALLSLFRLSASKALLEPEDDSADEDEDDEEDEEVDETEEDEFDDEDEE